MSGTVFRLCPVGGYDIPALEIWLEKMAGKGLVFDCTGGPSDPLCPTGSPLPSASIWSPPTTRQTRRTRS